MPRAHRRSFVSEALLTLGALMLAAGTSTASDIYNVSADSGPALSRTPATPDVNIADISPEPSAAISPKHMAEAPAMSYGWAMILDKYLSAPDDIGVARFGYGALKANQDDREALDAYILSMEEADPAAMSADQAVAFWANLYNAVTIKAVVDHYPVKSIREIRSGWRSGPWRRDLVTVNGKKMSLDDIEHKTMREKYPSPLIHYMVNCASVGCPNLMAKPWTAEALEADREAAARAFINSSRGVRITDNGLKVSSIYKWYQEDFGNSKAGVLEHIRRYADTDLANAIDDGAKVTDYGYIWALNE